MEKIKRNEPVSSISGQSMPVTRERFAPSSFSYQNTSWLERAKQYLADLGTKYDELTVRIGGYSTKNVSDLFYSAKNSSVLFVSEDFLHAMGKNQASFERGMALLSQAAKELTTPTGQNISGMGILLTDKEKTTFTVQTPTVAQWEQAQQENMKTLFEKMEEAKREAEKIKGKTLDEQRRFRIRKIKPCQQRYASAGRYFKRLCKAESSASCHERRRPNGKRTAHACGKPASQRHFPLEKENYSAAKGTADPNQTATAASAKAARRSTGSTPPALSKKIGAHRTRASLCSAGRHRSLLRARPRAPRRTSAS